MRSKVLVAEIYEAAYCNTTNVHIVVSNTVDFHNQLKEIRRKEPRSNRGDPFYIYQEAGHANFEKKPQKV